MIMTLQGLLQTTNGGGTGGTGGAWRKVTEGLGFDAWGGWAKNDTEDMHRNPMGIKGEMV